VLFTFTVKDYNEEIIYLHSFLHSEDHYVNTAFRNFCEVNATIRILQVGKLSQRKVLMA